MTTKYKITRGTVSLITTTRGVEFRGSNGDRFMIGPGKLYWVDRITGEIFAETDPFLVLDYLVTSLGMVAPAATKLIERGFSGAQAMQLRNQVLAKIPRFKSCGKATVRHIFPDGIRAYYTKHCGDRANCDRCLDWWVKNQLDKYGDTEPQIIMEVDKLTPNGWLRKLRDKNGKCFEYQTGSSSKLKFIALWFQQGTIFTTVVDAIRKKCPPATVIEYPDYWRYLSKFLKQIPSDDFLAERHRPLKASRGFAPLVEAKAVRHLPLGTKTDSFNVPIKKVVERDLDENPGAKVVKVSREHYYLTPPRNAIVSACPCGAEFIDPAGFEAWQEHTRSCPKYWESFRRAKHGH